mmetsp:Transcript_3108/g.7002  ORF Transcript_3108/g.7002 Transcript_3108/m.7002 type:complete len:156 (+) Transcript_3108:122-589(+)
MAAMRRRCARKTGLLTLTVAAFALLRAGLKSAFAVPRATTTAALNVQVEAQESSYGSTAPLARFPSRTSSVTQRRIFGLGTTEILVILAVGAVVLGPEALKDAAKEAGKAAGDLKDVPKAFEEGMEIAQAEKAKDVQVLESKESKKEDKAEAEKK